MVGVESTVGILLRILFLLIVPDLIHSFTYSVPIAKRFTQSVHLPAYIPVPVPAEQRFTGYQPPEYDETYVPAQQTVEEYNPFEKYPIVPVYGYYPPGEKQDSETYGYVEEEPTGDQPYEEERSRESYPYGQETFFEGGNDNAETNAVFLQNLILDQMYRDAAAGYPRPKYSAYEDESDRHWSYGIPVTEVDYSEGPENEDESVRELESLREPELPEKISKEHIYRNLRMQKKANGNSRKNRVSIDLTKKSSDKSRTVEEMERRNKIEVKTKGQLPSTAFPATEKPKVSQGKSAIHGQKEYVLPRPANPVRRPFERVERASVYNTIKRLLSMEDQAHKKEVPRIQKRFVLNEDQLTSQLSGLEKMAV